jgi:hypothetical protein
MLRAFLASQEQTIEIASAGTCHLCPDWPPLRALRVVKTDTKLTVEELRDGVLRVAGRPELLEIYIGDFWFESDEGGHHHPEYHDVFMTEADPSSVSVIIEVDPWADDPIGWARENA